MRHRYEKLIVVGVCVLTLEAPPNLIAGQSFTAESGTASAQPVSGQAASLVGETVVVHGKRMQARPLPPWLKEELNAPLEPTPTAMEKKIAPVVRTARYLWVIATFIIVFAGGIAKAK